METDVLVVGGGATGMGIAWDVALRGSRVVLVEMGDLATGTSGRYHGLLHSGGRYAVRDLESARECSEENRILRHVVPHVIEDTGGLFALCPGDDEAFVEQWLAGCRSSGVSTQELTPAQALKREPALNPGISCVFEVQDGSCDSWDLVHTLQHAAEQFGAKFLTYHRVDLFLKDENRVIGAQVTNLRNNETFVLKCSVAVLAGGPWSAQLAALAGVDLKMKLSRGAMLAFNMRWVNTVINRLRIPGDGDIFVPVGTVSVTGTTSVPTDDPADARIDSWEIQRILSETEVMVPGISRARVLRGWAGVRPLYDPGETEAGREVARTFAVIDHAQRDGVEGLVTVAGGKLTTFRLMAEKTADVVCEKLGIKAQCMTAQTELLPIHAKNRTRYHHLRSRLDALEHGQNPGALICECEVVTSQQIEAALKMGSVATLNDLRRDLRVGMGPCQGAFCAFRTAALRHEMVQEKPEKTRELLTEFVNRRFGGVKPLLWGHNLRQALLAEHIYHRILGLGSVQPVQNHRDILRDINIPRDGLGKRIVVIGAGLSGLMAALTAAESGAQVHLVAQGQGALALYPGWLEIGNVEILSQRKDHPYQAASGALSTGLGLLNRLVGISQSAYLAVTATGTHRQVGYAVGSIVPSLSPSDRVGIVGIEGWRDFYPQLVIDTLKAAGYQAHALTVKIPHPGNFDNWPIDVANWLDTPAGLDSLINQVKNKFGTMAGIGFPAVLGFKSDTRRRLSETLECPIFEIPTLPPSIPGMRLYNTLRHALLEKGVRFTLGPGVTGLVLKDGRVEGVTISTANGRVQTIKGDAVILCTGGLFGGGLESDYQGKVRETVVGLPVGNVPPWGGWFTEPFLSGQSQPVHRMGITADSSLRPLDAIGEPFVSNLYAAGRILSGYSPISEGSTEGVDIATGVFAARQAIEGLDREE